MSSQQFGADILRDAIEHGYVTVLSIDERRQGPPYQRLASDVENAC